jgi:hypothetical protein
MALLGIEEGLQAYGVPGFVDNGGATYRVHLYTNNAVFSKTSTLGASPFTECTDASYAAVNLTPANWVLSDVAGVTNATYPAFNFNFATNQTIYGYYVTDSGNNKLCWAEQFAGAPLSWTAGVPLNFTPFFTLQ